MNDTVLATRSGHVATWTLNLPEQRNPISDQPVVERIEELVAEANDDIDIRVVIITGAGKGFSSGGNVKHMVDSTGLFGGAPHVQRNGYRKGIQRIPRALYHLEVPLIAAVNGAAIGAGCDLALMADMRIASEKAIFAESFVKLGIIPGDGGAWLLPRAVGNARAAEMAFTGDTIDAKTALDWGLVSRVVAPEALLDEAMKLAERVASNPPNAVRMTKKLLREGQHMTLESLLELSAAMQPLAHHTRDHREALEGFVEKRPTNYTGE
ncbi:crotonase/enoyl-CoA hydratase family protein [Aldersonia kunmingensis]|uniref:crotonase/enoyl-CoA hydratase family protein n=1 Tax=Aldersonia kunmingensis TaxID=408066 RepID=UPI0008341D84|nr:crotonase/enoyl-CoA hydratase family protein [Aldersonia kunmingensis]